MEEGDSRGEARLSKAILYARVGETLQFTAVVDPYNLIFITRQTYAAPHSHVGSGLEINVKEIKTHQTWKHSRLSG
jgi:hypothetical protein